MSDSTVSPTSVAVMPLQRARNSPLLTTAAAATIALVALCLAWLLYLHPPLAPQLPTRSWSPAELVPIMDTYGRATPEGFEFRPRIPAVAALFGTRNSPPFRAADYPFIEVQWGDVPERASATVLWHTAGGPPNEYRAAELPVQSGKRVVLWPSPDRGWTGELDQLLVRVTSDEGRGGLVRNLAVRPLSLTGAIEVIWNQWIHSEMGERRAINFISGGTLRQHLPPAPVGALWVALSLVLFLLFAGRRHWRMGLLPVALAGWLLLDLRWQLDVYAQHRQTQDRFAKTEWRSRALDAVDAQLMALAERLKAELPKSPQRIFVLTPARSLRDFQRLRLAYHLIPHQVQASGFELPSANYMRPSDYVLVLGGSPVLAETTDTLNWQEGSARVELQRSEEGVRLYRVLETILPENFRPESLSQPQRSLLCIPPEQRSH